MQRFKLSRLVELFINFELFINSKSKVSHHIGPGQTGDVWPLNNIKHCLVRKHADVEVSCQTVKTCLI